ncbi:MULTISPECIES: hypothetical protein [Amycolatopsis]|uniref:hypothetical protein n=1 Tax=Amycolatopsis TaxID=1813 RepID=UPI0018E9E8EF|nr:MULTISPECIES: hypothetical protein [Amycolatopsis]
MRLLLLITAASHAPSGEDGEVPGGAIAVVRGQLRLQKLDFWVRYPDYLANELMNEYEKAPDEPYLLVLAGEILDSEEPDLRRLPMLRHRFGAFEPLDDVLAPLVEKGLVRKSQLVNRERVAEHRYWLTARGQEVAATMLNEAPAVEWYRKRTQLVVQLSDGLGGEQLKRRQYLVRDYADTPWNSHITPITDKARARLSQLRERVTPAPNTSSLCAGDDLS